MNKALLLSLALVAFPVAAAQSADTTTNNTTTGTALDPNADGVVDTNNNGKADTREFPWGLLGLLGLAGLSGLNRRSPPVVHVDPNRNTTGR